MKVRIYKPHTHAGQRYTPGPDGVEIEVSAHDAEFLKRTGVTTRPVANAAPADPEADIPDRAPTTPPAAAGKK